MFQKLTWVFSSSFLLACGAFANAAQPVFVEMKTSAGTMVLELDADKAPSTVNNFVAYVKDGFYEGTIFHRVIQDFMIQGGGMDQRDPNNEKKTRQPIKNESTNGLSNAKYTIAMARTSDPNSATSQFFINTKENKGLDRAHCPDGVGYCVFGKVVRGTEIVDAIAATQVTRNQMGEMATPVKPIIIEKVTLVEPTK